VPVLRGVLVAGSVVLLTSVHHALVIQTTVWAISVAMEEGGRHSGIVSGIAVALSWPGAVVLSSPARAIEYGWIVTWANSLIWGLGLTVVGRAALRALSARRDEGGRISQA
jgi:hypothetical protein